MKLKKIASLALAGLMAVSMLAACGGNNSSNNGGASSEGTTSTGIVSALNNEQDTIDFVSDSTLSKNLEDAVKAMTNKKNDSELQSWINKFSGIASWTGNEFYNDSNKLAFDGNSASGTSLDKVNPVTAVKGVVIDNALTEEYAVSKAVKELTTEIDKLKADDLQKDGDDYKIGGTVTLSKDNSKYHTYDYTGKVSMTSVKNTDGTTYYYFVMVVTQNVTEQEWKA